MTDKSMRMLAVRICLYYDLIHKIKNRKTSEDHISNSIRSISADEKA